MNVMFIITLSKYIVQFVSLTVREDKY